VVTKINPDNGGAATLAYSTYLGGGGSDTAQGIAVDSSGAAYVAGITNSSGGTGFPTQDPFQAANGGTFDAFITKINPDSGGAVTLAYSTYLGGTTTDAGDGIAVDSAGAAYVSGFTQSAAFPAQDPITPPQVADTVNGQAFVTKVNPDSGGAATLAYSTYLGGSTAAYDEGYGIAVDSAGAAYVAGETDSTNFPTQDQFQTNQTVTDGFVTKINPDTGGANQTLAYSTYLGGSGYDNGRGIAVDSAGAAYVAGETDSTDFPTQDPIAGQTGDVDGNAYITKVNPDAGGAATLAYSTYLGGSLTDFPNGIAIDSSGAAYPTGTTSSTDFPTQDPIQTAQGGRDAFATKVNADTGGAATLGYSTYLGGTVSSGLQDSGNAIAVDSAGAAYLAGFTPGPDFPTQDPIAGQTSDANGNAYITKLELSSAAAGGGGGSQQAPPQAQSCNGVTATIPGTPGNDKIVGTSAADVIAGLGGNDVIAGLGGKDRICGNAGKDKLNGGPGNDRLLGGSGKDRLKGGRGKDTCIGGSGRDTAGACEKVKSAA
jgi:hypothetical protein